MQCLPTQPGIGTPSDITLCGNLNDQTQSGKKPIQFGFAAVLTIPQSPSPDNWQPNLPMPYAIMIPGAAASSK